MRRSSCRLNSIGTNMTAIAIAPARRPCVAAILYPAVPCPPSPTCCSSHSRAAASVERTENQYLVDRFRHGALGIECLLDSCILADRCTALKRCGSQLCSRLRPRRRQRGHRPIRIDGAGHAEHARQVFVCQQPEDRPPCPNDRPLFETLRERLRHAGYGQRPATAQSADHSEDLSAIETPTTRVCRSARASLAGSHGRPSIA